MHGQFKQHHQGSGIRRFQQTGGGHQHPQWKASSGYGYVTLLPIEGDRLIVSVVGYTYCLDARTGQQLWFNGLSGFGTGVASIATMSGHSGNHTAIAAAAANAQRSSSGAAGGGGGGAA